MPEAARGSGGSLVARSPSGMRRPPAWARPVLAGSSTMLFQAPQASQRPAHLAKVAPQAVQAKAGRRALIG